MQYRARLARLEASICAKQQAVTMVVRVSEIAWKTMEARVVMESTRIPAAGITLLPAKLSRKVRQPRMAEFL